MYSKTIKLSPSSLNLFQECPRCFWLEKRLGIKRPPPYPYTLNTAVDGFLKREFDGFRQQGQIHPLLAAHQVSAKFFPDQGLIDQWRNNFKGIVFHDQKLDATLFGAIDDVLQFENGQLAPLDVKATGSREGRVYNRYQLQLDVYTYLLAQNNHPVANKGYLAFYVVDRENSFKDYLPFRKNLVELETKPETVTDVFERAVALLRDEKPPSPGQECLVCRHVNVVRKYY